MATSIGVREATRNDLERVKRELDAASLDTTLVTLLSEHEELKERRTSDRFLRVCVEHRRDLAHFSRRHHVRSLAVFGSAVHGDARAGSDLDLLVEFKPGKSPGLIGLGAMARELSDLLGVPVDLETRGSLSPHIRDDVLSGALPIHVEA